LKYVPKTIKNNPNISKVHPLTTFGKLLAGALILVVTIYVLMGLFVGMLAPHVPVTVEKKLGDLFVATFTEGRLEAESARLQKMLDEMLPHLSPDDRRFNHTVTVVAKEEVNALALPGGHIVVFKGLLDEVENEDEIRFVLAHELGHFNGRDHLLGLGRSLVTLTLSIVLFGNDSVATDFLFGTIRNVEMKFSQRQEVEADLFALNVLARTTKQCQGGTTFMERLAEQNKHSKLSYYFASHPHPKIRLKKLAEAIERNSDCTQRP